jgi:hypothetical protein
MEQVKGEIPEPKGSVKINVFGVYKFIKKLANEKFKIGFLFRKPVDPSYTISGDVPGSTIGTIPERQRLASESGDRADLRNSVWDSAQTRLDINDQGHCTAGSSNN